MRDAVHVLMEGAPSDLDIRELSKSLLKIDGVIDVHHLHAWTLTSNRNVISAHIRIQPNLPTRSADILEEAHHLLKAKYKFYFSTLQIETACLDEDASTSIDV